MAVLEKLNTKGGYILAIIIGISLIAFILGDLLDPGKSLFTVRNTDIAKVKGKSISYTELNSKIQEITSMYKLQTGSQAIDEEVQHSINEQAYKTLVNEIVMQDEYDALGLQVTSDELFDVIQGPRPHSIILSLFSDPETGSFSRSNLLYFLKNKNTDATGQRQMYWSFIENEIYTEQLATKYINLIKQGLYIPSFVVDNDVTENAKTVDMVYVMQPLSSIPDSTVKVSKEAMTAYYNSHINQFKQGTSRDINYILFRVDPSEEDEQSALKWIEDNKAAFMATDNAEQFLALNSDEKFDDRNYAKDELPAELVSLYDAEIGATVGPYRDDMYYKFARLVEINMVPDSISARHILIQPEANTQTSIAEAKALADSLFEVIQKGGNFAELAAKYSTDKVSGAEGGNLGWFSENIMISDFAKPAFAAAKGETILIETTFGYHIVQVTARSATSKKVKVAVLARQIAPGSQTYQKVYAQASSFAGEHTTASAFVSGASEGQLAILTAPNLSSNDYKIADYSAREVVRWAYNAKVGDVSPCIALNDAYIVALLTDIREEGIMPLQQVSSVVNMLTAREVKGEQLKAQIASQIAGASTMEEVAARLGTALDTVRNVSFASYSIPTIGIEPAVSGVAGTLPQGRISAPVAGSAGVYVLQVVAENPDDTEDRGISQTRLERAMASRADSETLDALEEHADIRDLRLKFY